MLKEHEKEYSFETELLERGAYIRELATNPETAPIYLTTAFNVEDLAELQSRYDVKGFCYNRNRNPNRSVLIELMTYLEKGENSILCSSGMAAISTAILSVVKKDDHILADRTLYGETIDIFTKVLPRYGVETTFVDFTDLAQVKTAVRKNTRVFYTETVSNPMITVTDIDAAAELAHRNGAVLIVDNTFLTAAAFRPIEHGADLTVNSLTKFANGHSDAVCGSVTGRADLIQRAYELQVLLGTMADAFTSWLVQRGIRTLSLRLEKQMSSALKLAAFLEKDSHVEKVHYPGLPSHPQYELARRLFPDGCGAMLSFVVPEDRQKINAFMRRLNLAHYAMTLGGYRTTLSHPVMSSHYDTPEEERKKIGITYGLIRVSVGIENPEDLVEDFRQALTAFD